MNIKRIFVPIDFSERSQATARHALLIAKGLGAEPTFAYVVPGTAYSGTDSEHFYGPRGGVVTGRDLDELYEAKLEKFVAGLGAFAESSRVLLKGDPASEIVRHAESSGADLIVIGTHGIGSFRKLLIGSVTAKVLHDCNLPVFTGAHLEQAPSAPASYRHIACAIDLDDEGEQTMRWAWDLAQALGARFSVIYASTQVTFGPELSSEIRREWHASAVAASRRQIDELLTKSGLSADCHVAEGHPVHYTIQAAAEIDADLLVIGRGGASSIPSRLPSHAYGIIRESQCPVISI